MSSWDRQATLEKYSALFDSCESEEALLEELGTPTKQAIELARSYVPTPPPVREEAVPAAPAEAQTGDEHDEAATRSAKTSRLRPGGMLLFVLLLLLIGIPVTVVLVCIGIPVLAVGIGAVAAAVTCVLQILPALTLFSDILLVIGAGLVLTAVGLAAAWLGLWLSLELGALWLSKVVFPLGRRLCRKKEVPQI